MSSMRKGRLNQLATPKGTYIVSKCEICVAAATTNCTNCKAYYCNQDHKLLDWESFHQNVCSDLAFIYKEQPILFSDIQRQDQENSLRQKKMQIMQIGINTAKKWLFEGNPKYACPPATRALRFGEEIFGTDSVEKIIPYCLLAEVYLVLKKIGLAHEYIVQATWISKLHAVVPCHILAQLHRTKGLVYMHTGHLSSAKESFAEYVYFLAESYGTKDVRICVGYSYLGLSHLELENFDGAFSYFHKMADLWLNHFLNQYQKAMLRAPTEIEINADENIRMVELEYQEIRKIIMLIYEAMRRVGMKPETDKIIFKIYIIEYLGWFRKEHFSGAVYREEALAAATRTLQDKAVPLEKMASLKEILKKDYIMLWHRQNKRPRNVATKYLEKCRELCDDWEYKKFYPSLK